MKMMGPLWYFLTGAASFCLIELDGLGGLIDVEDGGEAGEVEEMLEVPVEVGEGDGGVVAFGVDVGAGDFGEA